MGGVEELVDMLGGVGVAFVGIKGLEILDKSTNQIVAPGAGPRRYGHPRSDIERLQRHFGKDWTRHDVSELPPRGTGLRRTTCRRGRKPKRKTRSKKRRSRSRR